MIIDEIAVIIGSIMIVSSWMPQIFKLLRTKSSRDISIKFLAIVTIGTALLVPHSVAIADTFFIGLNSAASVVSGIALVLAYYYRVRHEPSEDK